MSLLGSQLVIRSHFNYNLHKHPNNLDLNCPLTLFIPRTIGINVCYFFSFRYSSQVAFTIIVRFMFHDMPWVETLNDCLLSFSKKCYNNHGGIQHHCEILIP